MLWFGVITINSLSIGPLEALILSVQKISGGIEKNYLSFIYICTILKLIHTANNDLYLYENCVDASSFVNSFFFIIFSWYFWVLENR